MDSYSSSFSSSPSSSDSLEADDLEAGSCSGYTPYPLPPPPLYAGDWRRKGSSNGGPMARFFFEDEYDEPRHFLDSCFLCKRTLAGNRDIFMYRGDTPFCSEECRQEQIEMDEAREKMMKLSLKKSSAKEQKNGSKNSPQKPQKIHLRSGTVVAG